MCWTDDYFCADCDEWSDTATCDHCGGEAERQLLPRERERGEDDGAFYGHPRDFRDGLEEDR